MKPARWQRKTFFPARSAHGKRFVFGFEIPARATGRQRQRHMLRQYRWMMNRKRVMREMHVNRLRILERYVIEEEFCE